MANVLTSVPSRQRTEGLKITLTAKGVLGGDEEVESRPVRAAGYNAVVGLVVSDVAGTLLVQAAPEIRVGARRRPGTWITIATIPTTLQSGVQAARIDEEVTGDFIRLVYVNGPALQTVFQFSVYLVPVFGFKRVEVTGPAAGAVLIAGEDSAGATVVVAVTPTGDLLVAGAPGATILGAADTPVGALATAPLPVPPAGTRRMTIQNIGPAGSRIRVREVGGSTGVTLTSLGSTSFGGADGAIAPVEAQDVAGVATTVSVTFEGT